MGKFTQSREETHLSSSLKAKLISAEYLENSLSAGSKKRLSQYRRNLSVSHGTEKPLFDDKVLEVLRKYALDPKDLNNQLDYLNHLVDPQGYKFSRDLKIYSEVEKALTNFKAQDHPSFRWNRNYQKALKKMKAMFKGYCLKPLIFNDDDDIKEAIPKEDTHSGFYWILSGNKKKGDNMDGIYLVFRTQVTSAIETGTFDSPILLGFRTQASGEYEDDGSQTGTCKHKTRLVSMYDLVSIVNELQFAVPFQNLMAKMDFYAGGKDEHEISNIINRWKVNYKQFFSIDYSNFDATISSWLIEDAFSVVREAFGALSEEQETLFKVMVHDFIHKDFVVNEGVLHVDRGVPSGSMWTQIIDSIVNALVILTYFIAMQQEAEMIIMGDDNCIFTNFASSLSGIATYVMKNFGLTVKVDDKSSMGQTNTKEGIKFLSRYWRFDGQYRNPHQLLSRIVFPERFRSYSEEVKPEMVVYAFILTYGLGMAKLINCQKFLRENSWISKKLVLERVDSRYLPGSLAYIREYTRRRNVA